MTRGRETNPLVGAKAVAAKRIHISMSRTFFSFAAVICVRAILISSVFPGPLSFIVTCSILGTMLREITMKRA